MTTDDMGARMQKRMQYVPGIDLVRFACAMLVVVYHLGLGSWVGGALKGKAAFPELVPFAWFGWIGVDVFFVISGFVIAQSALGRTSGSFLWHRVLRLYPAAWICASITAVVMILLKTDYRSHVVELWLASVALLPAAAKIDVPYWTLDVEIVFYLFVAACIAFKSLKLEVAIMLLAFVSTTFNIVTTVFFPSFGAAVLWDKWFHLTLLQFGCSFGFGGLIYFARAGARNPLRLPLMLYAFIGCLAECWMRALDNIKNLAPHETPLMSLIVFAALMGAIGASIRYADAMPARVARHVRTIGLATYPLYLVHNAVGQYVERYSVALIGRWPCLILAIAVSVALSLGIVKVEPRVRGVLQRLATARAGTGLRPPTPRAGA